MWRVPLPFVLIAIAALITACRSKNDDAPIDIPLPSDPSGPSTTSPGAPPPGGAAATARPGDPRRTAPAPTSTGDAPDPSRSGAPSAKPKASGRPISTQL